MNTSLIWGEGPKPCNGMIIGEAPGAMEEKEKRPFVGRAGKKLMEAIERTGAKREDFFITNAYKLRPPSNRTPSEYELAKHSMYLQEEIFQVEPKVILTLGNVATSVFLLSPDKISTLRGSIKSVGGMMLLPTYHPSYILRNRSMEDVFFNDVENFVRSVQDY